MLAGDALSSVSRRKRHRAGGSLSLVRTGCAIAEVKPQVRELTESSSSHHQLFRRGCRFSTGTTFARNAVCIDRPSRVYVMDQRRRKGTEDFERFFRAQFPTVARSLGLVMGNREDGIELAQEAFARAWARWDRYGSVDHARNSVMRIGINLARSEGRRRRRLSDAPEAEPGHSFEGDVVPSRIEIVEALRTLTERQRTCIVLTDYVGMDSREVARLLHIPAGSVRTHVGRARRHLRALLDEGDEEAYR